MASVLEITAPATIDLPDIEDQHAFNLAVWEKAITDPELARVEFRIETDRYGNYIMAPPPRPEHGEGQSDIAFHLRTLLPHGRVITECPISTSEGVKIADVAWSTRARRRQVCLTHAPEICVDVFSPSNTRREMREKRALYFEAGAEEVWFCDRAGRMTFFLKEAPETLTASRVCPEFPTQIDVDEP